MDCENDHMESQNDFLHGHVGIQSMLQPLLLKLRESMTLGCENLVLSTTLDVEPANKSRSLYSKIEESVILRIHAIWSFLRLQRMHVCREFTKFEDNFVTYSIKINRRMVGESSVKIIF